MTVAVPALAPTTFIRPVKLDDALAARAANPGLLPIAGGTDVMVGLNFGHLRPAGLLDLSAVAELSTWTLQGNRVRIGATVPLSHIERDLRPLLPALATAARTVGSPQIRNRGTIGGNLGTASPAGDTLPVLVAAGATVELASVEGTRTLEMGDFLVGPKRHAGRPDEIITAVEVPLPTGPETFAKVGTRNAMVIAVAGLALRLDADKHEIRAAIGSAAPTVRAVAHLEELSRGLPWDTKSHLEPGSLDEFAARVTACAAPIDDVRGSAPYRLHALAVLARRTLSWVWRDHLKETQ